MRSARGDRVRDRVSALCPTRDAAETAADIAADPLLADAVHVLDREWVGRTLHPSSPLRLSRTPPRGRTPAPTPTPTLGRDNALVLRDSLGVTEEQLVD